MHSYLNPLTNLKVSLITSVFLVKPVVMLTGYLVTINLHSLQR